MSRQPDHPRERQWTRRLLLALLIPALAYALPVHAQQSGLGASGNIEIEEGGAVWIEGSASVVDYTCRAQRLSGEATVNLQEGAGGEEDVEITVSVPVRTLQCGKKAMNRDMYEALKSERFPLIRYRLLEADVADTLSVGTESPAGEGEGTWFSIRARGVLTIAGMSDTTETTVRGLQLDENRFRVKGSRELHMDTFGITPPSALMGLIRADKRLTVHFNLTVRLREGEG
ncbi:MAG: YceI family protein [Balneolaceae bacterium]|nr:YceI family protein [Balneolaceae bacterium]